MTQSIKQLIEERRKKLESLRSEEWGNKQFGEVCCDMGLDTWPGVISEFNNESIRLIIEAVVKEMVGKTRKTDDFRGTHTPVPEAYRMKIAMNLQTKLEEIEKSFNEKFGQFYVSIDSKTKAIRIVDIVDGIKVNGKDGSLIECVASGDVKSFYTSQIKSLLEEYVKWAENQRGEIPSYKTGDENYSLWLAQEVFNRAITHLTEPLKELIKEK